MRGQDQKFLAIVTTLDSRRFSVRTEILGGVYQFGREAFFGQHQNARRYFPVYVQGDCRSEPKCLAILSNLNARRFSFRTKIPGGISQFDCVALFSQNRNTRQSVPVKMRGACRPEPEFLAVFTSVNARSYSARTAIPGDISQFECEVVVGQNQNTWRYFPVQMRGVFRAEPKFLAIFISLNAGRFAVRNKVPGGISQFKREASVRQNRNSWRCIPF